MLNKSKGSLISLKGLTPTVWPFSYGMDLTSEKILFKTSAMAAFWTGDFNRFNFCEMKPN